MAGTRPTPLSHSRVVNTLLNTAQSSYYKVTIPVPGAVVRKMENNFVSLGTSYENINLLCCEASLPGSSLTTHEANNDYHGVTEKMAYRRMYDEALSLTFYVDRDYQVIELFETWMDYITGVDVTNKSPYTNYRMAYPKSYKNPYASYRMAYPSSYKANMSLTKFEKDHFTRDFSTSGSTSTRTARTTLDYTFVQAFPLALTSIPVSYEASDVLKCSVSFNFIRYVQKRKKSVFSIQDVLGGESTRDLIVNKQPELVLN